MGGSPRPGLDVVPITSVHISLARTLSQGHVQLSVRLETVGYLGPQDEKENMDVSEHYHFLPLHSVLGSDLVCSRLCSRSHLSQSFASKPLDLPSLNLGFCFLLFSSLFLQPPGQLLANSSFLADLARLDATSLWFPSNPPCLAPSLRLDHLILGTCLPSPCVFLG